MLFSNLNSNKILIHTTAPGDSEGREAWYAAVYGITESQTWLSGWTTTTNAKWERPMKKKERNILCDSAAAAAKSLQSCPTLCDPIDGSPPGSPVPSPMHERKSESEVTQLCLTLSHPMDCSLPGSSVHGIFQARVLEWGAIAFSPTSTNPIHSLANTLCFIVSTVNVRKGFYCWK